MNYENLIHIKCLKGRKQSFNRFLIDREMLAWEKNEKNMMILDTGRLYYVLLLLIGL